MGLIPGLGRSPWRRKWQPTPVFLPGESHGQRSLAGCIQSMGSQESDMTERLSALEKNFKDIFQLRGIQKHMNRYFVFKELGGRIHNIKT